MAKRKTRKFNKAKAPPPPADNEDASDDLDAFEQGSQGALMRLEKVFQFEQLPLRHGKSAQGNRDYHGKIRFLKAMVRSMGIVTTACASAGVTRPSVLRWRAEDEVFAKAADELSDVALDFVEGKLMKGIQEGDMRAIIFYLRTKGRVRGYVDQHRPELPEPDEGGNVFGSEMIALSELQKEIPKESLKMALEIGAEIMEAEQVERKD